MVKDSKIIMKQAIVCSGNNKGMRGQIVAADNKSVTLELILDFRVQKVRYDKDNVRIVDDSERQTELQSHRNMFSAVDSEMAPMVDAAKTPERRFDDDVDF